MTTLLDQMGKLVEQQRTQECAAPVRMNLDAELDAQALAKIAEPPKARTDGTYKGEPRKRMLRPLTEGQLAFIDGLVRGKTQRQAYKDAFPNDNSNDQVISASASQLCKHPRVAAALEQAAEETIDHMVDDKGATYRWVLKQLMINVKTVKQESSRLRALELIGRAVGMFQVQPETPEKPLTVEDLKRQLDAHVALIGDIKASDSADI